MPSKEKQFGLNILFVKRLFALLKLLFPSLCSTSSLLFGFLMVVVTIDELVVYFVGILPSEFFVVLGRRDSDGFQRLMGKSLAIVATKSFTFAVVTFASSVLYITWRKVICERFHIAYFSNAAYYEVNILHNKIDNPDQRMTADIEATCRRLKQIVMRAIIMPFVIAYYTFRTYQSSGYLGPLIIYTYFICGTIANKIIMNPIVGLVAEQERKEGDFRYKHVTVRSNAEAIAFFSAANIEQLLVNEKLSSLLETQRKLINWQFLLKFSMNLFDYVGSILSYFIVAFSLFVLHFYNDADSVEISRIISENSFFYMYLINSFSTLIDLSKKFSDLAGTTNRVMQLYEHISQHSTAIDNVREKQPRFDDDAEADGVVLVPAAVVDSAECATDCKPCVLRNITYSTPGTTPRVLARNLSLTVRAGQSVLVTGESSCGKTALFRAIRGLWAIDAGSVHADELCRQSSVLFLPQKAYFPNSSLRQIVVYPHLATYSQKVSTDDQRVWDALTTVEMHGLASRVGSLDSSVDWNWSDVLSPGEMQRLAFARLLYHRPKFAFLDEATSAIGFELEERLYVQLVALGVTFVSIAHRESLRRFHQLELRLSGNGAWSLSNLGGAACVESSSASLAL